jgi:hypothetical protein
MDIWILKSILNGIGRGRKGKINALTFLIQYEARRIP